LQQSSSIRSLVGCGKQRLPHSDTKRLKLMTNSNFVGCRTGLLDRSRVLAGRGATDVQIVEEAKRLIADWNERHGLSKIA
jgi:hypothetical protein